MSAPQQSWRSLISDHRRRRCSRLRNHPKTTLLQYHNGPLVYFQSLYESSYYYAHQSGLKLQATCGGSLQDDMPSLSPPPGWHRPPRREPTCTPSRAAAASSPPRRSETSGSRRSSSHWTRPSTTRRGRSPPSTKTWRTQKPTRRRTWSSTM